MEKSNVSSFIEPKKKQIFWVSIAGLLLFAISVIIAATVLPDMISSKHATYVTCLDKNSTKCSYFLGNWQIPIKISRLQEKNHFLYIGLIPSINKSPANAKITLNTTANSGNGTEIIKEAENIYSITDGEVLNLIYVPYLDHSNYNVKLGVSMDFNVLLKLDIILSYLHVDYFNSLIAVKYTFLVLNISSLLLFFFNLIREKVKLKDWKFETTAAFIMNILLIIYNEPLIGGYSKFLSVGYSCVSVFSNTLFFCALILYFTTSVERLIFPKYLKLIYLGKFFVISALFGLYFSAYLYIEMNFLFTTPSWSQDFSGLYKAVFQALIAILVITSAWTLFVLVFSITQIIKLDLPQLVYWSVSHTLLIFSFIFIGLGYFQLLKPGIIVLILISLYNIYFYIVLWLFTPSKKLPQKKIPKKPDLTI